jgi:penicillin-binding protein 2
VGKRYIWASGLIIAVLAIMIIRLWYLQIYQGDYYRVISENNRIRKVEIPAPRGMIFDRNGTLVLGNRPFFDLVAVPQYMHQEEQTLAIISQLLHEPLENLGRMLRQGGGRAKFLPTVLKRNLSVHEVAIIESNKVFLPGIEILVAPRRDYQEDTSAHLVGYMGEISGEALKRYIEDSPDQGYLPGDLVGKQGLELRWESYLRGKRGYRFIQVDAFGRQTNLFEQEHWQLPTQAATAGSDLNLTIDIELQNVARRAFQGKYGAIVAMNPQNGEILALVSSPDFKPTIYQDKLSIDKWHSLLADPFKPLFDKTTAGTFPPGSVYKPIVAFAALAEGIITPHTTHYCNGSISLGREHFHCYERKGHGAVDVRKALIVSCDVFFYKIALELGIERIAKYAKAFGLGDKLGFQLNREDPGLIPTNAWKKSSTGTPWSLGDIPPIAIGQGANLVTPMQIASIYATIANGGKVWRPYMVKKIINHLGATVFEQHPELIKTVDEVSPAHFKAMREYLTAVVMEEGGLGRRSRVDNVTIAGKTGSVQVVSLKKNRNRKSVVSMKWQEHALFAAFSPAENAEIAVAIISENDTKGSGGTAAAPIAQKIFAAYWQLKAERSARLAQGSLPRG